MLMSTSDPLMPSLGLAQTSSKATQVSGQKKPLYLKRYHFLRFAKELTVNLNENQLDLSVLDNKSLMHVRGKVKFLPGEWIEPNYYSNSEFKDFLDRSEIPVKLAVRSYPYSIEGLKTNYGSFIIHASKPNFESMSINFPRPFHAMDVYIVTKNDVFKVYENGKLSKPVEDNKLVITVVHNIPLAKIDSDFYIIGHLSAPYLEDGYAAINMSSFFIGENKYLSDLLFSNRLFVKALVGCFLIIAIFYTFIYIFRWRDFSSLYIAIYSVCSFGLGSIYVETYGLTADTIVNLFTALNITAIAALQAYCLEKLKFRFSKTFISINLIGVAVTLVGILISLSLKAYLAVNLLFLVSSSYSAFAIFTTLYQGVRHKIDGIAFFAIGTTANLSFQVPLMISYLDGGLTEIGYDVLLANVSMAICLALVNAKEFAATFQRSINQSIALKRKTKKSRFLTKTSRNLSIKKQKRSAPC